jgi:hypothetical protein
MSHSGSIFRVHALYLIPSILGGLRHFVDPYIYARFGTLILPLWVAAESSAASKMLQSVMVSDPLPREARICCRSREIGQGLTEQSKDSTNLVRTSIGVCKRFGAERAEFSSRFGASWTVL